MEDSISYDFIGDGDEVTVLREESKTEVKLFAPKHVYLKGKLLTSNHKYTYKLRMDDQNPYMEVDFSSNTIFSFYPVDYSAVSYYIKGVYRHDKIAE